MAHVRAERLRKSHGSQLVLDDISLDIPSGQFLTLLGPSGCGKSSTLRIVAGLSSPDAGRILIDERDVTRLEVQKRNIGMVFQSHALFPHMSVNENVAFGLRMRKVSGAEQQRRVRRALAQVRLEDFGERFPQQLSGGQQQRVAIARALVVEPSILILDEPFGALDRKLREAMQTELYGITRELGITALFVTHDQEEALMLSDSVAVMNRGRIEQVGPPAELYERPRNRFVAEFMGLGNFVRARLEQAGPQGSVLSAFGQRFEAPASALPAGSEVEIAVRPERIRLAPQAQDTSARVCGRLTQAIYHGHASDYTVQLPDGQQLLVRQESAGQAPLSVGTEVWAHWQPLAVNILEAA
ncbi:MAG: ABC transporter ATP-binding protein [Gammaproteobacteria bacterium]